MTNAQILDTPEDEVEQEIDKLTLRYSSKELFAMGGREALRQAAESRVDKIFEDSRKPGGNNESRNS